MKEAILNFIQEKYGVKFTGRIKVFKIDDGHILKIYDDSHIDPIISLASDAEDFVQYVKDELTKHPLTQSEYFKVVRK